MLLPCHAMMHRGVGAGHGRSWRRHRRGGRGSGGLLGGSGLGVRLKREQWQTKQYWKQAHRGGSCGRNDTTDFPA
jgi:hypothetical protein